jgi:periplasmic divalent cation tolerance protein
MDGSSFCVVATTTASQQEARKIAEKLLTKKLAACVQILDIESFYTWQDTLQQEPECLLLIKTRTNLYPNIEKVICAIHSYEVPEIIQLPITQGLESYLGWITANTIQS